DRVLRLIGLAGENGRGLRLAIVLRPVAEPIGVRVVVPRALVVRDAVDDLETDVRVFEPDADELGVVARADPDREPPAVDRLSPEIADPGAEKADPVLVGVQG